LKFVRRAQHVGFTLKEIKGLLDLDLADMSKCMEVQERIREKIKLVEKKEKELKDIKAALKDIEQDCNNQNLTKNECPFLDRDIGRTGNATK